MFTGIVEELGEVTEVASRDGGLRLRISAAGTADGLSVGDSVAVNGCCLTAVEVGQGWWSVDAVPETIDRTTLGELQPGSGVNLERPLAVDGRLGGHVVQGHVDGVGHIVAIDEFGDGSRRIQVGISGDLSRYVAEKGSVAVDGVSLTVAATTPEGFEVAVIPHTLGVTRFGRYAVGDRVNIEVDILAKYVERLLDHRAGTVGRGGESA